MFLRQHFSPTSVVYKKNLYICLHKNIIDMTFKCSPQKGFVLSVKSTKLMRCV